MPAEPMLPVAYRVVDRRVETRDSATLLMEPVEEALPPFEAGQFTMLYARGVGEVAISISGDPSVNGGTLTHTIRDVGAVSRALHDAEPGTVIGARGPFGTGWDLDSAAGHDVVIVAGGVGLAPLRSVVLGALANRGAFGRVTLIAGARGPAEFLFRDQLSDLGCPARPGRRADRGRPGQRLDRAGRVRHRTARPALARPRPDDRVRLRAGADDAVQRRGPAG